ncbi:MAG TPA: hypothetical protein VG733_00330, partial [Chthoniobacteraceae bacterium]|nr:hypothetical protein [Chthoniobacteraceae bacterium]
SSPIPKQTIGRTFFYSILTLGVIALLQIGAVGWAFIKQFHSAPRDSHLALRGMPTPASTDLTGAPILENPTPAPLTLAKPTPIPMQDLNPAMNPAQGRLDELLAKAKALSDLGDMSTALTRLREALVLAPEDPRVLSGLALVYEKMGQADKANEYWQHIYNEGKNAGDFYDMAEKKLFPDNVASGTDDSGLKYDSEGFPPNSVLALVDITKTDSRDAPGKKFTLKVPVRSRPGSQIDVQEVKVYVLFYEQLPDETVVINNADVVSQWITSPIDWSQNNIQILSVGYTAASLNPKMKGAEERAYYGYIVRVYYKGSLQDVRAEPAKLLTQFPPPHLLTNGDEQ